MIDYRLDDLGWFEFEQLIQTLAKARLGFGIESWGGRGDWGRDAYFEGKLRYPTNEELEGAFVFQAKFVEGANAAGAKPEKLVLSAVERECERIRERLEGGKWNQKPAAYALFTNAPLSAVLRKSIHELVTKVIPNTHLAIHDGSDVCQWLRLSPEIVRSFPQLLSLRDLQDLLQASVHADIIIRSQTAITLAQVYSRVFVPTEAYDKARHKLHEHGFVVLEGPPEMGKTTIGRIIALSQVVCGWEAIECRMPTDVLKLYRQDRRQVFVADDFFGRTEYEPMRVSEWQSELAHILPLLDRSHWLILTCRVHLLEMAKTNLDIAGQNHRFPELGEVVVQAGKLKQGEKARMLYRHAKAVGLSQAAKELVKRHAAMIVADPNFTPERIRRLVEELVPKLAIQQNLSEADLKSSISEALVNPTKQMQISFRKLPSCHRWMIYALLETDRSGIRAVGSSDLQSRYDALCPPHVHEPAKRVLDELTEAFIKKSRWFIGDQIDWIHPSCRDLAIDELSAQPRDRQRFLSNCSETGLALAMSFAGGAKGLRQLPLLQEKDDWKSFETRAKQLISERPTHLLTIWNGCKALKEQAVHDAKLLAPVERLTSLVRDELIPRAAPKLGQLAYADSHSLRMFFKICNELQIAPVIDPTEAWTDCVEDVRRWTEDPYVIWQDERVPGQVAEFLSVLQEFCPVFLAIDKIQQQLQTILELVLERANSEDNSNYASPKSEDEIIERANAFEALHLAFGCLAELPMWPAEQQKTLQSRSVHFESEANSLREDLPGEPDSDDSSYERSNSEDLNIDDLFRDL